MPPDTKDASGWTAIMWAAASGQIDTVKLLETANADVKPKEGDWDPLMVAAANGEKPAIKTTEQLQRQF